MIHCLLIVLFIRSIVAQDAIRNSCYVCISPDFYVTKPDVELYTGDVHKRWRCQELESMAQNGEFGRDVCSIVQGYVLRDCGCDDGFGRPPPEQPYVDYGAICNVCGGEGGSDFDQVTRPEAFVDTGVGISAECQFIYEYGFMGAFTSGQCEIIQTTIKSQCGCGNSLTQPPTTPAPVTLPPSMSVPVTLPPTTLPPVTTLPTTSPPTLSPPTSMPPTFPLSTPEAVTQAPIITPEPTMKVAPSNKETKPSHVPLAPTFSPTAQVPTLSPSMQPTSTTLPSALTEHDLNNEVPGTTVSTTLSSVLSTVLSRVPSSSSSPSLAQTYPSSIQGTTMKSNESTLEPSPPCLESGASCQEASECCLGLCDFGVCSIEVTTITNPVTSSASLTPLAVVSFSCLGVVLQLAFP